MGTSKISIITSNGELRAWYMGASHLSVRVKLNSVLLMGVEYYFCRKTFILVMIILKHI